MGMNNQAFTGLQASAAKLDLRINQLQNSAGVMSDEDQQALNDIEAASKQLLQSISDFNKPEHESEGHREAVEQDKKVRPGETRAQHADRMKTSYPTDKKCV